MSRDFDAYCPECEMCHAIRGFITDSNLDRVELLWCKETGKFWVDVSHKKELHLNEKLKMDGKKDKDWRKAEKWVYENLDNLLYSGE